MSDDNNSEIPSESKELPATHSIGPRNTADPESLDEYQRIGNYRLVEKIGEGGFGSVWLAEQEMPVRRKVALKLIKDSFASAEIISRFEAERQALAMMNHPNIAKILYAGSTSGGSPYFVMELVEGIPLTKYCDKHRLSIRQRLQLFIPVCKAVQHAHQKGIIHRDLKPSNILVTAHDGEPVPKVIDFGLAKALDSTNRLTNKTMSTEFGRIMGTIQYMSPEQAEINSHDIDTRSDIYSLGIVLFELLTGSTPIEQAQVKERALLQILETIRNSDLPRPSQRLTDTDEQKATDVSQMRQITSGRLQQILRGELDWIVMKALERDRTRRYETASGFAADIGNYLNGEVVNARPPSTRYVIQKFIRRHRGRVAVAGLFVSLLIILVPLLTYLVIRAREAETLADRRLQGEKLAKEVAESREKLAIEAVKNFAGVIEKHSELKLNPNLENLRNELLEQPRGFFAQLKEQLRNAYENSDSQNRTRFAEATFEFARISDQIGNKKSALYAYLDAIEVFRSMAEEKRLDLETRIKLARIEFLAGVASQKLLLFDDAIQHFTRADENLRKLLNEKSDSIQISDQLANVLNSWGILLSHQQDLQGGLVKLEEALKIRQNLVDKNTDDLRLVEELATVFANVSTSKLDLGKLDEGIESWEASSSLRERLVAADPSRIDSKFNLAWSNHNLANRLFQERRIKKALAVSNKATIEFEQSYNERPTITKYKRMFAESLVLTAILLDTDNQSADALKNLRRAEALFEELIAKNAGVADFHLGMATCQNSIGVIATRNGDLEMALTAYKSAKSRHEQMLKLNPNSPDHKSGIALVVLNIAMIQSRNQQTGEAIENLKIAIKFQKEAFDALPNRPGSKRLLSDLYFQLSRLARVAGDQPSLEAAEKGAAELNID